MKKILIIDDDRFFQESIQSLLEGEGFQTIAATDGRSGIKLTQEHLPALILCDVQMPDMDGYTVLETLHQQTATATIPFIFLSGKRDIRHGMNLGADDYLTKPFKVDELLQVITKRLEKQSLYQSHIQEQLDELRRSIAKSLPHEFRTPMTNILFSLQLLRDYSISTEPKVLELIDTIQSSTERLYRIIRNYLLFVELETKPSTSFRNQPFLLGNTTGNLDSLIVYIITQIAKHLGRESDLQFDLQTATLVVPESHFVKVIEELTDNAFKFSKSGTPVEIRSATQENKFVVTISNQGWGMTSEQIARIGAYQQFERDRQEQQGMGLGLILSKRLLELYGGHLKIESIPGQSISVTAAFPIHSSTRD